MSRFALLLAGVGASAALGAVAALWLAFGESVAFARMQGALMACL